MNPIVKGYYADPEARMFGNTCWVFCTLSQAPDNAEEPHKPFSYMDQKWFDAFSSVDFQHWQKVEKVLNIEDISWGDKALWAPSQFSWQGKYYVAFACNDIQNSKEIGGIGLAVADTPVGPFRDFLGHPLIGNFINGAQPIDPHIYIDNETPYLFYGGWQHCNLVRLSDDLRGVLPLGNGHLFLDITPQGYVEAPFMMKYRGRYYFMWSEGDWTTPNYQVVYGTSRNIEGPFISEGVILKGDNVIANGPGHHSVVQDPASGDYYIFYHRRDKNEGDSEKRVLCMDRLIFDQTGSIAPVKMT